MKRISLRPARAAFSAHASAPCAAWGGGAGLTLLELVLTMGILGVVFGAGIGILASLDLTSGQSAGLARSALSAAANAAMRAGAPARLVVGDDLRSLYVVAPRTLGTWHFERDDGAGGRGLLAANFGALPIDDGHLGRALSFRDARDDAYVELSLGTGAGFDPSEGFALHLALRLEGARPGRVFDLAAIAGLDVLQDGALRGWMRPLRIDALGRRVAGARRDVEASAQTLQIGRWTRVALTYDRVELRLVVDDFPVGIVAEDAPVAPPEGRLALGGPPRPFAGSVDSVIVLQAEQGEPLMLPETLRWPAAGPRSVRFEADGALDRSRHPQGLEVVLEGEGSARATVRVTAYGAVQ